MPARAWGFKSPLAHGEFSTPDLGFRVGGCAVCILVARRGDTALLLAGFPPMAVHAIRVHNSTSSKEGSQQPSNCTCSEFGRGLLRASRSGSSPPVSLPVQSSLRTSTSLLNICVAMFARHALGHRDQAPPANQRRQRRNWTECSLVSVSQVVTRHLDSTSSITRAISMIRGLGQPSPDR